MPQFVDSLNSVKRSFSISERVIEKLDARQIDAEEEYRIALTNPAVDSIARKQIQATQFMQALNVVIKKEILLLQFLILERAKALSEIIKLIESIEAQQREEQPKQPVKLSQNSIIVIENFSKEIEAKLIELLNKIHEKIKELDVLANNLTNKIHELKEHEKILEQKIQEKSDFISNTVNEEVAKVEHEIPNLVKISPPKDRVAENKTAAPKEFIIDRKTFIDKFQNLLVSWQLDNPEKQATHEHFERLCYEDLEKHQTNEEKSTSVVYLTASQIDPAAEISPIAKAAKPLIDIFSGNIFKTLVVDANKERLGFLKEKEIIQSAVDKLEVALATVEKAQEFLVETAAELTATPKQVLNVDISMLLSASAQRLNEAETALINQTTIIETVKETFSEISGVDMSPIVATLDTGNPKEEMQAIIDSNPVIDVKEMLDDLDLSDLVDEEQLSAPEDTNVPENTTAFIMQKLGVQPDGLENKLDGQKEPANDPEFTDDTQKSPTRHANDRVLNESDLLEKHKSRNDNNPNNQTKTP